MSSRAGGGSRPRATWWVATAAVAAGAVVTGWRLGGRVRRVEVVGGSMAPGLAPGDRLVVVGPLRRPARWPAPGTVVAVRDPRQPSRLLVKRVASVDPEAATAVVLGDAAGESTDSRTFGPLPLGAYVGAVRYRYAPAGRTGRPR